mgnify:CR=1 FL=1
MTLAESILKKPSIILEIKSDNILLFHQNQELNKEISMLRNLLKESIQREENLDHELRLSIIREERADEKIEHQYRELSKLTNTYVHRTTSTLNYTVFVDVNTVYQITFHNAKEIQETKSSNIFGTMTFGVCFFCE